MIFDRKENTAGTNSDVCPKCGLKSGTSGSMTTWIFQNSRCECNKLEEGTQTASGRFSHPDPREKRPAGRILNGRYQLLERVGHGGQSLVYKAEDLVTKRMLAIKLMRPEFTKHDLAVRRLIREVETASKLSHPNLVRVHGYGQDRQGEPYLVMDFVTGENLDDLLLRNGGKLPQQRVLEIMMQICAGLRYAHANGVIHRDLKPSNVIVSAEAGSPESVKIVDFGFAKLTENVTEALKLTQSGEVFGSPLYMSPEHCLGKELDERSDIYSLGCLFYQALSGMPPLVGDNLLATVAKQVTEEPLSMRTIDRSISESADNVALRCLAKNPIDRYQSVDELLNDLRLLQIGKGVPGRLRKANRIASVGQMESSQNVVLNRFEPSRLLVPALTGALLIVSTALVWLAQQKLVSMSGTISVPLNSKPVDSGKKIERTPETKAGTKLAERPFTPQVVRSRVPATKENRRPPTFASITTPSSIRPGIRGQAVRAYPDSTPALSSISPVAARQSDARGDSGGGSNSFSNSSSNPQANYSFPGIQFYAPPGWVQSANADPQVILWLCKTIPSGAQTNIMVRKIDADSVTQALSLDEEAGRQNYFQTLSTNPTHVGIHHLDAIQRTVRYRKDRIEPRFQKNSYAEVDGKIFCFVLDVHDEAEAAIVMNEYEMLLKSVSGGGQNNVSRNLDSRPAKTQTYKWRDAHESSSERSSSFAVTNYPPSKSQSPRVATTAQGAYCRVGDIQFFLPAGWVRYGKSDPYWLGVFYKKTPGGGWLRVRKMNTNSVDQGYKMSEAGYRQNGFQPLEVRRFSRGLRHPSAIRSTLSQTAGTDQARIIHCAYVVVNDKVICFELNAIQAEDASLLTELDLLLNSLQGC